MIRAVFYRVFIATFLLLAGHGALARECEDLLRIRDFIVIGRSDHHKLYAFEGQKVRIRLGYKVTRGKILGPASPLVEDYLPGEYFEDEKILLKQEVLGPYWLGEHSIYLSAKTYEGRLLKQGLVVRLYDEDRGSFLDLTRLLNRSVIDELLIKLAPFRAENGASFFQNP